MTITLSARDIKLRDLSEKFNLHKNTDRNFFNEWRDPLPELTDRDREFRQTKCIPITFFDILKILLDNRNNTSILSQILSAQ
jgi:hypothetical protein